MWSVADRSSFSFGTNGSFPDLWVDRGSWEVGVMEQVDSNLVAVAE